MVRDSGINRHERNASCLQKTEMSWMLLNPVMFRSCLNVDITPEERNFHLHHNQAAVPVNHIRG
jgi:hypothetical protein